MVIEQKVVKIFSLLTLSCMQTPKCNPGNVYTNYNKCARARTTIFRRSKSNKMCTINADTFHLRLNLLYEVFLGAQSVIHSEIEHIVFRAHTLWATTMCAAPALVMVLKCDCISIGSIQTPSK